MRTVQRGLETYMSYRAKVEHVRSPAPKRLIFYRGMQFHFYINLYRSMTILNSDGVSEGEFQQVKDQELKRIQGNISSSLTPASTHRAYRRVQGPRHQPQDYPYHCRKAASCPIFPGRCEAGR